MTTKRMAEMNRITTIIYVVSRAPYLTYKDVAKLMGCSRQYISNIALCWLGTKKELQETNRHGITE